MNDEERVTYFGETDARNKRLRFGIKKKDRSRHMYVIGKTGMGKSTLLENLAVQDILNGEGLAFIDPHGKSADLLLEYIPEHRIKDVVYFAPFDLDYPISFNVLEDVGADRRHLVANGLMSAFKKIWVDAWSARMEYILTNILLALLEYPGSTLLGVNRMLVDKDFRNTIVNNISDPSVKAFWTEEYAKYTDKFAAEAAPAIQNKVGQFVANPLVRNIIGQSNSSFNIREIIDNKKIFIVNLSKGRVGEGNANLLGAMIITKIYLAAMSRADLNESELKKSAQFYLYVDEFQSFANESFADILSEARKYKLNLTIAHQYVEQMTEEVRAAVFGNVGTMAVFRVGAYDADIFQKEFAPQFTAEDIVNLQQYQMYLKLMIDGVTSTPFSAKGMPPIPRPERMYVQEIIDASRAQFARSRIEVEEDIRKWHIEKIKPVGNGHSSQQEQSEHRSTHADSNGKGSEGRNDQREGNSKREGNSERLDRGQNMASNTERNHHSSILSRDLKTVPGDQNKARREASNGQIIPPANNRHSNGRANQGVDGRDHSGRGAQVVHDTNGSKAQNGSNFALRNAIRDAERERREHGILPKQVDLDREKELRDAISLNYLKDKKEEEQRVKNSEKDAKPQNVMALKEALLGLLGESVANSAMKESEKQIDSQSVYSHVSHPVHNHSTHKQEREVSVPQAQAQNQTERSKHQPTSSVKGTGHENGHMKEHKDIQATQKEKEVDPQVIEKIFE